MRLGESMKKFLVTQRRTRTVIEYRTVVVLSSEHYAVKDSLAASDPWVIGDIRVVDQENNVVEIG